MAGSDVGKERNTLTLLVMEKGAHNGLQSCLLTPPCGVFKDCRSIVLMSTYWSMVNCGEKKTQVQNCKMDHFSFKQTLNKSSFYSSTADIGQGWYPTTQKQFFSSKLQQHDPQLRFPQKQCAVYPVSPGGFNNRQ